MSVFSENLVVLRKQKNLSQEELAARSGVSQQAISLIEAGKRSPTEITMSQLADGLGVQIGDLLETKNPTAGSGDGIREEIIRLMGQVPQEDLQQIRDYVEWLRSRHAAQ